MPKKSPSQFKPGNPHRFKPGPDPRRNPGGVPQGARLSSAVLRVLNLPAGSVRKKGAGFALTATFIKQHGLTRTEADAAAEHIVALMRSEDPKAAIAAFRAIGRLTEGDTLTIGGSVDANLKDLSLDELIAARAEIMGRQTDAGKPVRKSARKKR